MGDLKSWQPEDSIMHCTHCVMDLSIATHTRKNFQAECLVCYRTQALICPAMLYNSLTLFLPFKQQLTFSAPLLAVSHTIYGISLSTSITRFLD